MGRLTCRIVFRRILLPIRYLGWRPPGRREIFHLVKGVEEAEEELE